MKYLMGILVAALVVVGAVAVPTASAQAAAVAARGCVTYREASRTLDNSYQSIVEIQRGFGTKGVVADRVGKTMWKAYRPCRRPRQMFVHLIYVKRAGKWKSMYWVYSLIGPAYRTHSGTWGHR
ncbi:putative secreted Zn-dependent protease [Nocardioides thalensis]|uniref:Putative secreted Zn-dependent protease n=1 Tax=Nocardioides thalensis TaxID=1914755 RepID=A0A853BZR6_9ACTN|nr:hypothetical protein [Nocardioides thalensis]NYI99961.1 putative secreted Zn-dependent protease [Nocardioides thalensis]